MAAVVTLPLGLLHVPGRRPGLDAVASLLTLGVICTGFAFVIFHSLVASDGPARASLVGYIAPVFSIVYGVVLLDESFSVSTAVGARPDPGRLVARPRAASCPHAAAMSRPRVTLTVVRTPRVLEGGAERGDRVAA